MGLEEDDMHSARTTGYSPTCPLCGLGYANEPLLELHIREDHLPSGRENPDHGESAGGQTSQPAAGGKYRDYGPASGHSHSTNEVTPMTAARQPRHPRLRRAMTSPRRAFRGLRYLHEELMRPSEAMTRSARAPESRPQPDTPAGTQARAAATTERTSRAA